MLDRPGTVIAVISDTHIGGYTALSLPEWTLQAKSGEELPYKANLAGLWLYERWLDYWDHVKTIVGMVGKTRKHRIVTIHCGDICDGNHHGTIQALQSTGDQVAMASEIMTQVANLSDGGVYGCIGTDAHNGGNGALEFAVSKNVGFKKLDQELLLDIDGLIVMAYHHGRAGGREWTSSAAGVAVEAKLSTLGSGQPAPRLVLCGHNHRIDDSGEKVEGTRAIALPSWQLRTAFGYKVASGKMGDIGGLVIHPTRFVDFSQSRYKAAPGQRTITKV